MSPYSKLVSHRIQNWLYVLISSNSQMNLSHENAVQKVTFNGID